MTLGIGHGHSRALRRLTKGKDRPKIIWIDKHWGTHRRRIWKRLVAGGNDKYSGIGTYKVFAHEILTGKKKGKVIQKNGE